MTNVIPDERAAEARRLEGERPPVRSWRADRGSSFYVTFAWVAVVAAVVGFSTTYWIPIARRTFAGPWIAHLHGLLFFVWIALLLAQVHFARAQKIRVHRRLGGLSLPLALAMAATGIGVGMHAVRRDLAAGVGDVAYSQLVGVVAAMSFLVVFVAAALATRKAPDWHKRFILLATIAVLWPAWFRWRHLMPWIPRPDVWLGLVVSDSLIVIAAIRDRTKFGRIHPVYAWFGTLLVVENVAELVVLDTPLGQTLGKALFTGLSAVGP